MVHCLKKKTSTNKTTRKTKNEKKLPWFSSNIFSAIFKISFNLLSSISSSYESFSSSKLYNSSSFASSSSMDLKIKNIKNTKRNWLIYIKHCGSIE